MPVLGSGGGNYLTVSEAALSFLDPRVGGVLDGATDNAAAFAAAFALLTAGGDLYMPPGIAGTLTKITVPGGVTVRGSNPDLSGRNGGSSAPTRGSIIRALGTISGPVVQLGSVATSLADNTTFNASNTAASLDHLTVDGANVATSAVEAIAPRWQVDFCQVMRGTTQALNVTTGQNGNVRNSTLAQNNTGDVVVFTSASSDNKITACQVRGMGTGKAGVNIAAAASVVVRQNHIYRNGTNVTAPTTDVLISGGTRHSIVGNIFDNCLGHHISLSPNGVDIDSVTINGNSFYQNVSDYPDNTYAVVGIDASTSNAVTGIAVAGNSALGYDVTHRYKAFLRKSGATGTVTVTAAANTVRYAVAFADFTLAGDFGNVAY